MDFVMLSSNTGTESSVLTRLEQIEYCGTLLLVYTKVGQKTFCQLLL
jgi:hypothetical protein